VAHTWHHGRRAKQQRFGDLWWWYQQEPKWWRKLYKHAIRRAQTRQCVHRVLRGEDEILWPLDKRPWVYYW
jgi:hypothetical protein